MQNERQKEIEKEAPFCFFFPTPEENKKRAEEILASIVILPEEMPAGSK